MKEGIDSFLLDCRADENLTEVEASFGIKGFAIIVRLWQKIYSEKGYYCDWTNRSPLLFMSTWFGRNSGVDVNLIKEVVATSVRIGMFDRSLLDRYSILTSEDIQERYFNAACRRTVLKAISEYLLIDTSSFRGNIKLISLENKQKMPIEDVDDSFADELQHHVAKLQQNVDQIEVKEREEKRSKGKEKEKKSDVKPSETPDEQISKKSFPPALDEAVRSWVEYKTEKRQGYKPTGLARLLNQIERKVFEYGENAVVEAIDLAMSNNWAGIVWDRLEKQRKEEHVALDENGRPWPVINGVDWSTV